MNQKIGRIDDVDFAMTFDEIGRAEGITRGGAYMAYASGMRKLRIRRKEFLFMLELHRELERNRELRSGKSIAEPREIHR